MWVGLEVYYSDGTSQLLGLASDKNKVFELKINEKCVHFGFNSFQGKYYNLRLFIAEFI